MRPHLLALGVLVTACGHSRPERLRPYEEEPPRRPPLTLADGSTCTYEWLTLEPGVCRTAETVSSEKAKTTTYRSVACGAQASVCGLPRTCDCATRVAYLPCQPEASIPWPYEEGRAYSDAELQQVLAKLPSRDAQALEARRDFDEATCPLVVGPPRFGKCPITAAIQQPGDGLGHVWGTWFVPFGETREVCGVPVTCTCDRFKPRDGLPK